MSTQTPGYIYLLTNARNTVLYVGSTNDLRKRVYLHRQRLLPGFTKKYNVQKLVYFEKQESIEAALVREKQLKGLTRRKKMNLILAANPLWNDLYPELSPTTNQN